MLPLGGGVILPAIIDRFVFKRSRKRGSGKFNVSGLDQSHTKPHVVNRCHGFLKNPSAGLHYLKVATVGNPPFNHRADMVVKFFNESAGPADGVGFVASAWIRKLPVYKRLAPSTHYRRL